MHPRDIVRVCILLSFGAILIGLAAWMLTLGRTGGDAGLPPFIVLGAMLLLAGAFLLLGGAGADTVWAWLERLRYKRGQRGR